MLELLNELMGDVTPFYLYLTIALSMICAYRGIAMNINRIQHSSEIITRQWHAIRFRLLPKQEELGVNMEIQHWITAKTKRIEAPDDDTDSHSYSFKTTSMKKRGGQQWEKNLYSQSLKNIFLSESFY